MDSALAAQRIAISKRVRFEVFKRDKFTCNYCGKSAPKVVLQVDHIEPVSKGGTNDLLNLITSCDACNAGKSNIELADDSVIAKQHLQITRLQERREQIELMFEWRRGLEKLGEATNKMIADYIGDKIPQLHVSEHGYRTIAQLAKKFTVADLLEAIDISANSYLRYEKDGAVSQESAERFFDKIGGVACNSKKPPIERKLSHVANIGRKRHSYWNPKKAHTLLKGFVRALRERDMNDNDILRVIDDELVPKTNESHNWTDWVGLMETLTSTAARLNASGDTGLTLEKLDSVAAGIARRANELVPALSFVGEAFLNIHEHELRELVLEIADELISLLKQRTEAKKDTMPRIEECASYQRLSALFSPRDNHLKRELADCAIYLVGSIEDELENLGRVADPDAVSYLATKFTRLTSPQSSH